MIDSKFPLQNQVALVTGGNSGIGEGIVRCMAEAGAAVGVNYVSHPEAAEKIVDEIKRAGGKRRAGDRKHSSRSLSPRPPRELKAGTRSSARSR